MSATRLTSLNSARSLFVGYSLQPALRHRLVRCDHSLRPHSAGSTLPHLWPTCSSSGWPPLITARYFSSGPSDSGSLLTPCPPEYPEQLASGPSWLCPAFAFVPV